MLGGCAGTLGQLINRPITTDHLDEVGEYNKLKTVSGDLRLVRVAIDPFRPHPPGFPYYDVCAETQADAIISRNAGSALSIETGQSLTDASSQGILLTNARTAVSDVVRHMGWHLCNARLNNDLDEAQYRAALLKLAHDAMVVLQQSALGPKPEAVVSSGLASGAVIPGQLTVQIPVVASGAAATAGAGAKDPKTEEKPKSN
jgi:hypothetical protein